MRAAYVTPVAFRQVIFTRQQLETDIAMLGGARIHRKEERMYTTKQRERLARLHPRMEKLGCYYWGTQDGIGQVGIFTQASLLVPESENWMSEYMDGKVTSNAMYTALRRGITPYEAMRRSAAAKEMREKRKRLRNAHINRNKMNGVRLITRHGLLGATGSSVDKALHDAFPPDANGLIWLPATTDTRGISDEVARIVWGEHRLYCEVTLEVDWSAAMVDGEIEYVTLNRNDYLRLMESTPHNAELNAD